jgi:DNA-binding NtrC family response regulator
MDNSNFRVLVVDDDPAIASLTAQILEQGGFSAKHATHPTEAMVAMDSFRPHLLITDVMMPMVSGVELALAVRRAWPECKALLMTGKVDAAELLAAARKEGNDFALLQKPVPPVALLRYVRDAAEMTTQA